MLETTHAILILQFDNEDEISVDIHILFFQLDWFLIFYIDTLSSAYFTMRRSGGLAGW
jgi:hypothetical protein